MPGRPPSHEQPPGEGRRVLVTGASGGIGRALTERLLASGDRVVAVGRSASRLPPGVTPWVADLATGEGISAALFTAADVVFHCAGELSDPKLMRPLHVEGTRRLLDALRAAGSAPPRWVQLSSVGAYGPPAVLARPRVVDEQTPERPQGEYETTKTIADNLVREADATGLLSMAMVRPTAVIGGTLPSRSLRQLIAVIARGWYVHVGSRSAVANYVHVDDVVAALVRCAQAPQAAGEVFNAASDCLWEDLVSRVAELAAVARPRLRVPAGPIRGIAHIVAAVGGPLTPARVDALCGQTTYSSSKIAERLGLIPQRPMPAAVSDVMGRHARA